MRVQNTSNGEQSYETYFSYEEMLEIRTSLMFVREHDPDCDPEYVSGLKKKIDKYMKRMRRIHATQQKALHTQG